MRYSFILSPVAFLFNWIGFFLSFCLTTSAAGRYGAISGFGLSLIKWVLIVRVREYYYSARSPKPDQLLNVCSVLKRCRITRSHRLKLVSDNFPVLWVDSITGIGVQLLTATFISSSFQPTSPVTLMDSTGCGGCSWPWVSDRHYFINK